MKICAEPQLLDVAGALEVLPELGVGKTRCVLRSPWAGIHRYTQAA